MDCPHCGHENRADAHFCEGCGGTLTPGCPRCGLELRGEARFCDGCGAPVSEGGGREPRAYTPRHLADRILRARSAIEGERKQVTVLFTEVQRGDDGGGPLDAEELHGVMEDFLGILTEGVHRFEGTVNQYTAEGAMALFGAPLAHEDHARCAALAALQVRERLREHAAELKRRHGLSFLVRMGLNSGEVVVGSVGDDLRMDYTAHGHTVSLAARMMQLADPGRIYVSEPTAAEIRGSFELRELGTFTLKGVRRPHLVAELRGVLPGAHLPARARGETALVGRDAELLAFEEHLERAGRGLGATLCIEGEAGVGKSRLCAEIAERCRSRGLDVLEARTPSYGRALPFAPVIAILREYFDLEDADTEQLARNKIAGGAMLVDRELEEDLPLLFDFLGVPDPARPPPELDPERRMERLVDVAVRLMRAGSRQGPAIVIIEDLQWIDPGSELFVRGVAAVTRESPSLLILNYRPDYDASWTHDAGCEPVRLRPLAAEDAGTLLEHLAGDHPSLSGVREKLLDRARGNPFFLIELIRGLADGGPLVGAPGRYELADPDAEIRVPGRVQALVAARIDRLPEAQKQLLRDASVIGVRFTGSLLARASGFAETSLRADLLALVDAGFLVESAGAPVREYAFSHPLIQEVAYESQLADTRSERHRRIARALLPMQPTRDDAGAALLAYHLEEGGDCLEAARWHLRAVRWLSRSDPGAARRHADRVRAQLGKVAESPETLSLRVEACGAVLGLGWRFGTSEDDAALIFEEGREAAERLGEPRAGAMLLIVYGNLRGSAGDIRSWYELPRRAATLAAECGDEALASWARGVEALGLISTGRVDETLAAVEAGLRRSSEDALTGFADLPLRVALLGVRATLHGYRGRFVDAERDFDTAAGIAAERDAHEVLGHLYGWRSRLAIATGDGAASLVHARRSLALAERTGSAHATVLARLAMGGARHLLGEWQEACAELEDGLALARRQRAALNLEVNLMAPLARSWARRGDAERGLALADEAHARMRERGQGLLEAEVHCARARVLLIAGREARADAAEAALLDAESACERLGLRSEAIEIDLARAELLALRGEPEAARRRLGEALAWARSLGAGGHVARIEQILADGTAA